MANLLRHRTVTPLARIGPDSELCKLTQGAGTRRLVANAEGAKAFAERGWRSGQEHQGLRNALEAHTPPNARLPLRPAAGVETQRTYPKRLGYHLRELAKSASPAQIRTCIIPELGEAESIALRAAFPVTMRTRLDPEHVVWTDGSC
ncbi:hypothetical protein TSOC_005251, partial [Tetrabaena socialis]